MKQLDPKAVARMQQRMKTDIQQIASQTRGARRIKIEKGKSIVVRFLPAQMGPDNLWYACIAQHWLNKVPIICPKQTGVDFGGNLETHCPVCEIAEKLNNSEDGEISKFGWRATAQQQFVTYCLLIERDGVSVPSTELLLPYEFPLNKTTFTELHAFFQAGLRRSPTLSVLDYQLGNDFSVMKNPKGTVRLDKLDSAPIFEKDKNYEANITKIEAALKTPHVKLPTEEQLYAFADKLHDAASRIGHGEDDDDDRRASSAPRSRRAAPSDDGEVEERPARRRVVDSETDAEERPTRRAAPRPVSEDDIEEERPARRAAADDEERTPAPRNPRREAEDDEDEAPRTTGRRAAPPADETDEEPARRPAGKARQEEAEDDVPYDDPAPGKKRAAQAESDDEDPEKAGDADEADPEAQQPRGRLSSPPNRAKAAAAPEDEDDNLPPDDKDPVPPAAEMPKRRAAPAETDDEGEEPPQVERKGKPSEAIRRLAGLGKKP